MDDEAIRRGGVGAAHAQVIVALDVAAAAGAALGGHAPLGRDDVRPMLDALRVAIRRLRALLLTIDHLESTTGRAWDLYDAWRLADLAADAGVASRFASVLQQLDDAGQRRFDAGVARGPLHDATRRLGGGLWHAGGEAFDGVGLLSRLAKMDATTGRTWRAADVEALAHLAEQAASLLAMDAAQLDAVHRDAWLADADRWLARGDADPIAGRAALADLLVSQPALDEAVRAALTRWQRARWLPADDRAAVAAALAHSS